MFRVLTVLGVIFLLNACGSSRKCEVGSTDPNCSLTSGNAYQNYQQPYDYSGYYDDQGQQYDDQYGYEGY